MTARGVSPSASVRVCGGHAGQIHTVVANIGPVVEVAVGSWVRVSQSVKRELLDRVCSGASIAQASIAMGVSRSGGRKWWHQAGGVQLAIGGRGGPAGSVDRDGPGGRGHRLSCAERVEIMRGLDADLSHAESRHRRSGAIGR